MLHGVLAQLEVLAKTNLISNHRRELVSSQALVHQHLDLDAAVFGPPLCGFVGCRRIGCAHRPGGHNVSHRYAAILYQIRNNSVGPRHAQLLVHGSAAGRVSKTFHLNDVAFEVHRFICQSLERGLTLLRNYGGSDCEVDYSVALDVVVRKVGETLSGFRNLLLIGFDIFLTGLNLLLVGCSLCLVARNA